MGVKYNGHKKRMQFGKFMLTKRQIQVCTFVHKFMRNRAIGNRLRISEKGVKWHLTNIYKETGFKDRGQLIKYMYKLDENFKEMPK